MQKLIKQSSSHGAISGIAKDVDSEFSPLGMPGPPIIGGPIPPIMGIRGGPIPGGGPMPGGPPLGPPGPLSENNTFNVYILS